MNETAISAVIIAVLSLIGVLGTAFMNYKSTKHLKASEELKLANDEKEKANKKLEKQETDAVYRRLEDGISGVNQRIDGITLEVTKLSGRFDKMNEKMQTKINDNERALISVTNILSRNARMNSQMMRQIHFNEAKLQKIIQIEALNIQFTKDTSSALQSIGEIIKREITDDDDATRVGSIVTGSETSQKVYLDGVINAQMELASMGTDVVGDDRTENDINQIQSIIPNLHGRDDLTT